MVSGVKHAPLVIDGYFERFLMDLRCWGPLCDSIRSVWVIPVLVRHGGAEVISGSHEVARFC